MLSPVEEIKSRLDIVELIQGYIRLHKAGVNFKANCPFHGEKTASFVVSPAKQIWHCFGCSRGGDIFKFVMEIEGHDFPEALKMLAQRAGVILKREDPAIRSERNRLYDVCEEAAKIFEHTRAITPAVQTYLTKRGMTNETIQKFRVGFAPQSWDFLLKALATKNYSRDDAEKAGLAIRSEERSSWYDRFRGRIIFPITDPNGRVIGFGGRIFESDGKKEEAKYINTPQTLIYDKSRVLYGFDHAKQDIRTKNSVVVVEGYMDCVMSHQAGVANTIAVSGTALTPQQLQIIRRLCDTMVSSFDTDAAGDSATKRSLALAAQFQFERRIAVIPSGKDPADAVLDNPQSWHDAVTHAKPVVDFYFEKATRIYDARSVNGKKQIAGLVLPYVAELENEVEKAHWVTALANQLTVPEKSIWAEIEKKTQNHFVGGAREETQKATPIAPPLRRALLEERVLALLAVAGPDVRENTLQDHALQFTFQTHQDLFNALVGAPSVAPSDALQKQLDVLRLQGEMLAQTIDDPKNEFIVSMRELEKEHLKEKLIKIGEEIQQRERTGNRDAVTVLLGDFRTLSEKLKHLA